MALWGRIMKRALEPAVPIGAAVRCSSYSSVTSSLGIDTPPQLPRFDYEPKPYKGPSADEVLQKRKKFLGPSLFYYYQKPVKFQHSPVVSSLWLWLRCLSVFPFLCISVSLVYFWLLLGLSYSFLGELFPSCAFDCVGWSYFWCMCLVLGVLNRAEFRKFQVILI